MLFRSVSQSRYPSDIYQFAAATFNSPITVGSYNDSTHVETSVGGNKSSGNTPKSSKYLTSTTVSINGGASQNLNTVTTANSPIKINFSHGTSVATTAAAFYAYDGTTTSAVPTEVTLWAAEQGNSTWVGAEGSGAALALNDQAANTSHDFYILASVSPDTVGLKTKKTKKMELWVDITGSFRLAKSTMMLHHEDDIRITVEEWSNLSEDEKQNYELEDWLAAFRDSNHSKIQWEIIVK